MEILNIRHLFKSFNKDGSSPVLNDVNLSIHKGDIFGIIGLSGEGKSTLIRCINKLESYDSGSIEFYDDDSTIHVDSKLNGLALRNYRRKVAMIFQDFNLLEQRNVYDNIEFPHLLVKGGRHNHHRDDSEILHVIKSLGLESKELCYPSQLSGGQKQRVAIARALISKPSILLCDEITSALDPTTTNQILDILKELSIKEGLTIILIAHQMSVIERICNKVAVLSKNTVVETGLVSSIFINPQHPVTQSFLYSHDVVTKLSETNLIRLLFNGNTDEPIITNIVQDCNILVSIIYANSWTVDSKVYGELIFKLPYYKEDILKLKTYLTNKSIEFKEVTKDELDTITYSDKRHTFDV